MGWLAAYLLSTERKLISGVTAAVLFALYLLNRGLFGPSLSTNSDAVVPVFYFLGGMFAYAARDLIAVRLRHVVLLLVSVTLAPAASKPIVFYFFFAALVLWVGGLQVLADRLKIRNDISYGLYLYGFPVQQLLASHFPKLNPYELFLAALAITCALAAASWFLIERPMLRVPRLLFGSGGRKVAGGNQVSEMRRRRHSFGLVAVLLVCIAAPIAGSMIAEKRQRARADQPTFHIVNYGPTSTVRGAKFNVQPNGQPALWVQTDTLLDPGAVVILDGVRLHSVPDKEGISAIVPVSLVELPGVLKLSVEWFEIGRLVRSNAVDLLVETN